MTALDEGGDAQVQDGRKPDASAQSELRNQVETAQGATQHRPQRVYGIQVADASAQRGELRDGEPAQHGKCGAHERCGDQDDREAEEEQGQTENGERRLGQPIEPAVRLLGEREKRRDGEAVDADARFQEAVDQEGIPSSVGQAAEDVAPQRQASHEGREYGRDRMGGVPEDLREHPGPHHLVDQGGGAGHKKQCVDEREYAARYRCLVQGASFLA
jgi:hypothetical protein